MNGIDKIKENLINIDWGFFEDDTKYLTHSIHRYSGKYIPQIPKNLIETLSNPGDIILDPYMGSGTTCLESALCKRKSIGIDLNPLAILISKVKTTPIDKKTLEKSIFIHSSEIKRIISSRVQPGQSFLHVSNERIDFVHEKLSDPWFLKWYKLPILQELVKIHVLIDKERNPTLKNLFLVAFSDIVRTVSNAHPSYPNVMYNKKLPDRQYPAEIYLRKLLKISACINELNGQISPKLIPLCIEGNSVLAPFRTEHGSLKTHSNSKDDQ